MSEELVFWESVRISPQHIDQKKAILKRPWDILIILDACRYDYFAKISHKFFSEIPAKARSPASNTYEWAKKVLEPYDWKDVIYISANPWINSRVPVKDIDLRMKFFAIYDAWLHNWDDEKNTVWPDKLTDIASRLIDQ